MEITLQAKTPRWCKGIEEDITLLTRIIDNNLNCSIKAEVDLSVSTNVIDHFPKSWTKWQTNRRTEG